jgi:hypothetical protein
MSEGAMLSVAGAVILVLLGIIGWQYRQERKGILDSVRDGFTEIKSLVAALTARFDKLDERQRDCMTWEDWRAMGLEEKVREHDRDIASIKATCKAEREK